MKREVVVFVILISMILSYVAYFPSVVHAEDPNMLYVDDDGTADYTSIQEAVDNASFGGTVFVYSGSYTEDLEIDRRINLVGEDRNSTYLYGNILLYSNSNNISGFYITDETCILIDEGSSDNLIHDNNLLSSDDTHEVGTKTSFGVTNKIYHNNFLGNGVHAADTGGNTQWDNGYPDGGNYWKGFNGVDDDEDGISDIPFTFFSAQDRYPFMVKEGWLYETNKEYIITSLSEVVEGEIFNVLVTQKISGNAVNNAVVIFSEIINYTNEKGNARFTAPLVDENTDYPIYIEKDGISNETTIAVINQDVETDIQLVISAPSYAVEEESFQVTVTADGIPIDQVFVELEESSGYTDIEGNVTIFAPSLNQGWLESMAFDITASKTNYLSSSKSISVYNSSNVIIIPGVIIELINPGSETLSDEYSVSWSISNLEGDSYSSLSLYYKISDGEWISIIENHENIENAYSWDTTTVEDGDNYWLKLVLKQDQDFDGVYETKIGEDISDSAFSILNEVITVQGVFGIVQTEEYSPVDETMVCVKLIDENAILKTYCDYTDEKGEYQITFPAGIYLIEVSKFGYITNSSIITVEENAYLWKNFIIKKITDVDFNDPTLEDELLLDYIIADEVKSGNAGAKIVSETGEVSIYSDEVNVEITQLEEDSISFSVEASADTSKKLFFIDIEEMENFIVEYDGEELEQKNLDFVLTTDSNTPVYAMISEDQIVVLVPSFSKHSITVTSIIKTLDKTFFVFIYLIAAIVFLLALVTHRKFVWKNRWKVK